MKHPSSLVFFRWQSGDLTLAEWASLRWHLLRCARCSDEAKAQARAVDEAPGPARRGAPKLSLALATAALVVVGAAVTLRLRSEELDLTPKGSSVFTLRTADGSLLGPRCPAGTALTPTLVPGRPFVLVVAQSGQEVSALFPAGGARSAQVSPGDRVAFGAQWQIDDAPAPERFVAIVSDRAVSLEEATAWLKGSAPWPREVERLELVCAD